MAETGDIGKLAGKRDNKPGLEAALVQRFLVLQLSILGQTFNLFHRNTPNPF